jgi:hypothetical protein
VRKSDIPVTGDWNGYGTEKMGIFRNGVWFLDWNGNYVWDSGDRQHIGISDRPEISLSAGDLLLFGGKISPNVAPVYALKLGERHCKYRMPTREENA